MLKRRLLVASLALVFLAAFTLPALAQETVKGKIESFNKGAKKIAIAGTEYALSDEVAKAKVKVGDEVEATVEAGVVKKLTVIKVKK
jgi:hypothetical protein